MCTYTTINPGTPAQVNPLPGTASLTADLVQSLTYGNGLGLLKTFMSDNRLARWRIQDGATNLIDQSASSFDGVSLSRVTDSLDASETQNFAYSLSSRLASASGAYGTRNWTYDAAGNRVTKKKNGTQTAWAYPATSNRLTDVKQGATTLRAFTCDAEGNTITDARGRATSTYKMPKAQYRTGRANMPE